MAKRLEDHVSGWTLAAAAAVLVGASYLGLRSCTYDKAPLPPPPGQAQSLDAQVAVAGERAQIDTYQLMITILDGSTVTKAVNRLFPGRNAANLINLSEAYENADARQRGYDQASAYSSQAQGTQRNGDEGRLPVPGLSPDRIHYDYVQPGPLRFTVKGEEMQEVRPGVLRAPGGSTFKLDNQSHRYVQQ